MVTIYDIAKEAGVSISTVSNVIHGVKSHVSPDTVDRIKKIIEEKQYKPNMSARALATKNSRIVGMLSHVEKQDYTCLPEDPFLGMLFRSVEMELSARNYYLMIKTVSTEEELLDLHKNWNFAGMIIHGVFEGSFFNQLSKMSLPCVLIDSYIKHNRFLNIGLEDFKGAYAATSYLINKGHKNIAFASPDIFETGVVAERFAGYKAALKEAGIDFPDASIKISALLHDLCKVNFYKVDFRNTKNSLGEWVKVPYYTIDDTIPYGHGEKSVMMITEYIKLTPEEKYAIRWHMGFTEPKELYTTIGNAYKKYPLALLVHEADLEATYFFDI